MHRWTRLFIVAVTAVLTVVCLASLFRNSDAANKYATGLRTGFHDATAWGDWGSWTASSDSSEANWQVRYQTEKEKEDKQNNADDEAWRINATPTGYAGLPTVTQPVQHEPPTWLDDILREMREPNSEVTSTIPLTSTESTQTTSIVPTSSDGAIESILSAIMDQKTMERTVTVTIGTATGAYHPVHATPIVDLQKSFDIPKDMTFSPEGPKPEQVVLVTASDGGGNNGAIDNILALAEENRKAYCKQHGYQYHYVDISKFDLGNAHPVWKKVPAMIEAFNTYPDAQWLFFLDLDAIIMSPKQDLNSLLLSHEAMMKAIDLGAEVRTTEGHSSGHYMAKEPDLNTMDILIGQDHNGINAGSFFIRRSEWTKTILDLMADPFFIGADWVGQEQETLVCTILSSYLPTLLLSSRQLTIDHRRTFISIIHHSGRE